MCPSTQSGRAWRGLDEKLPFFAALAVTEVIVCDRDTKHPEVCRLAGAGYEVLPADGQGWLVSAVLGVRLRRVDGRPPCVRIEDAADASAGVDI